MELSNIFDTSASFWSKVFARLTSRILSVASSLFFFDKFIIHKKRHFPVVHKDYFVDNIKEMQKIISVNLVIPNIR